jgi:tetratricopeptide (TPR) repeat protein
MMTSDCGLHLDSVERIVRPDDRQHRDRGWRVHVLVRFAGRLALLWLAVLSHAAMADDLADCLSGVPGKRVASCTAAIDDPNTGELQRGQALENRSVDLSIAGKFPEAMRDVEAALQINPDSAIALNSRAWTLYRWKRSVEGWDDVNKSLQIAPMSAPAWDTRAHLHQLRGHFEKAFNEYEAAVGFGGVPFIRMYQCGLKERKLYSGPVDGIYSAELRAALRACALTTTCDPVPDYEFQQECDAATS